MERLAIDVPSAAEMLSVSQKTIRRMLRDGRLRAVRVGRRVVVTLESLRRLVGEGGTGGDIPSPSTAHQRETPARLQP
jgi:excisionase family DNA binding protein